MVPYCNVTTNPRTFVNQRETVAQEKPSSFFQLFDALTSLESFPTPLASMTPEAIHQASMTILEARDYFPVSTISNATKPSSSSSQKMFDLALALHVSSPKLEAYYQFYDSKHLDRVAIPRGYLVEECGSWVDWYGSRLCSSEDLVGVLGREALEDRAKTS
jgi:UDP-glucose:glycoprotein glucosyltransferase